MLVVDTCTQRRTIILDSPARNYKRTEQKLDSYTLASPKGITQAYAGVVGHRSLNFEAHDSMGISSCSSPTTPRTPFSRSL
jgi:hypothetical protein